MSRYSEDIWGGRLYYFLVLCRAREFSLPERASTGRAEEDCVGYGKQKYLLLIITLNR